MRSRMDRTTAATPPVEAASPPLAQPRTPASPPLASPRTPASPPLASPRSAAQSPRLRQRGAALIIVLAIMTILLAVGLTFYAVSRVELRAATNVTNAVRADLLADGAVAIAIAHLNQDFFANPDATSNDHPWKTIFNGAWVAGKTWAMRDGVPLWAGGVPAVDLNQPNGAPPPLIRFPDGSIEPLYRGRNTSNWLFIPRYEPNGPVLYDRDATPVAGYPYWSTQNNPFMTALYYEPIVDGGGTFLLPPRPDGTQPGYALEQIHTWADVDNSGDGLRDSVWIPLPADLFFSDDGVDNDLDGVIDNGNELATFVYWGGNNGLDNNGDGTVDGPSEQKFFLTSPILDALVRVDVRGADYSVGGNGVFGPEDRVVDIGADEFYPVLIRTPSSIQVQVDLPRFGAWLVRSGYTTDEATSITNNLNVGLTSADVDVLDNDYNLIINDSNFYAFLGPNTGDGESLDDARYAAAVDKSYQDINMSVYFPGLFSGALQCIGPDGTFVQSLSAIIDGQGNSQPVANRLRLTFSGEPVCELAGRAAILINDTAATPNLNIAGGHNYDGPGNLPQRALGRSNFGVTPAISPFNWDTRVLPQIGDALAFRLWGTLTGGPATAGVRDALLASPPYDYDISFPGYGRTDDNGNALLLALNGRDDTGSGLIDEGLYLPHPGHPLFDAYAQRLGAFEGIDEPGELKRFQPYRNLIAENDGLDNDGSGNADNIGELGDRQFLNHAQFAALTPNIGPALEYMLQQTANVFSTDRSVNYTATETGIRGQNRLDYNYSSPQQIAAAMLQRGHYLPTTARTDMLLDAGRHVIAPEGAGNRFYIQNPAIRAFAEGLRQAEADVTAPSQVSTNNNPGGGGLLHVLTGPNTFVPATRGPVINVGGGQFVNLHAFPVDGLLMAMQAAVNIVDTRDRDYARSQLTSEKISIAGPASFGGFALSHWPRSLPPREVIHEDHFFPLQEIERHFRTTLDLDRRISSLDEWLIQDVGGEPLMRGLEPDTAEARYISYTTTGIDAIKINELMVRPVRRVEAEATSESATVGSGDPIVANTTYAALPTNFNPRPTAADARFGFLPEFNILRRTLYRTLVDPPSPALGWQIQGTHLGEQAAAYTNTPSFAYTNADIDNNIEAPNVIEYLFVASSGLPPGRYYLKVNTEFANTYLQSGGVLEYSIKYVDIDGSGSPASNTILDDFTDYLATLSGTVPFDALRFIYDQVFVEAPLEHIARMPGQPAGWAFLDGTPDGANAAANSAPSPSFGVVPFAPGPRYFTDGGGDLPLPASFRTHTVTIPAWQPGNAGRALCVAIRMDNLAFEPGDTEALALNFFDFSQEPDHEWAEIINTSDEAVDVSRWQLEVGIPNAPNTRPDPFKSLWEIPDGTVIAPHGMLLLSFNQFDTYRAPGGAFLPGQTSNSINRNGIGLATTTDAATLNVFPIGPTTVPPYVAEAAGNTDPTGSPFWRETTGGTMNDFVDNDRDGLSGVTDNLAIENAVQSTTPHLNWGSDQPWDRIVEMRNIQIADLGGDINGLSNLNEIQSVDDVATFILRGGVFPNYPERDGIDNDGDGAYLAIDGSVMPGILDRDMVDNNLSGRIDYLPELVQAAQLTVYLSAGFSSADAARFATQDALLGSEGVDEGRLREGRRAGSYGAGTLPYVFFRDRSDDEYADRLLLNYTGIPVYTRNPDQTFAWNLYNSNVANSLVAVVGESAPFNGVETLSNYVNFQAEYIGNDADPPEWKALLERRWYPGDNVMVSLYQGSAIERRLVDRVTYTEEDVINRTKDDVMPSPYRVDGFHSGVPNGSVTGPDDVVGLNIYYPSFWLPNQMGLDFYRSLERKSPFYAGDTRGTRNRWEATDGNYDDWADSPSIFTAPMSTATWPHVVNKGAITVRYQGLPDAVRFSRLAGSPMSLNYLDRLSRNPLSLAGTPNGRQFNQPGIDDTNFIADPIETGFSNPWFTFPSFEIDPTTPEPASRNVASAQVQNRPLSSLGALFNVPQTVQRRRMLNTTAFPATASNTFLYNPNAYHFPSGGPNPYQQDIVTHGASLGTSTLAIALQPLGADTSIFAAATQNFATESIVLTAAKARFVPILPRHADTLNAGSLAWSPQDEPPAAWAPLYLFRVPQVDYPADAFGDGEGNLPDPGASLLNWDFLRQQAQFTGGLTAADADDLLLRRYGDPEVAHARPVAMYVSAYRAEHPRPEMLLEWDASDGIENGEYIVYVGSFLPGLGERLTNAYAYTEANNMIPFLEDAFAPRFDGIQYQTSPRLERANQNQRLALEVITDRTRTHGISPDIRMAGLVPPAEWDAKTYSPNAGGYMMYGDATQGAWRPQIVRVTDNYLALRVRNAGAIGQFGGITHVVLAPRKRIPGKININSAQNISVLAGGNHRLFNGLLGLPGVVDVAPGFNPPIIAPVNLGGSYYPPPPFPPLAGDGGLSTAQNEAMTQLSALMMWGRPEQADGRYYTSLTDLIERGKRHPTENGLVAPLTNRTGLDLPYFAEALFRYQRMSNLITTRSDVFEIVATVQAGYGVDANGNGHINYRSNEEFVATAETKTRVVYERRSAPDRSDQPVR